MGEHTIVSASPNSREGDQNRPRKDLRTGLKGTSSVSSTVLHYGLASILVTVALALSLLLQSFVPHGFIYLLLGAVVASGWLGSRGPGLFAALLASAAVDYFFIPPIYSFRINSEGLTYLLPFLLSALAADWINSTRNRAKEVLAERARLASLNAGLGAALTGACTLREGLQACTETWVRQLNAACARIWTLNETTQVLELEASAGMDAHIDGAQARLPVGKFKIGKIVQECKPQYSNDILTDDWIPDPEWTKQQGVAACAGYPLVLEGRTIGVVAVFARAPFSEAIIQDLASIAGQAAQFIKRKRSDEALLASEEQFRQLADNIHEVFFVVEPEPVRMAYLSPAYEEIWGRPRQEAYERPAAWIDSVHPEDREAVGNFFARCMQGIQSAMAYRILRPDGSGRYIEAQSFPVRNAEGRFIRVVGIAEDTTVRRETLEKLNVALEELKEQTQEAARLAELVDILQSCQNAEEAFKITGSVLQGMLRSTAGALYITSPSRDIVEMVASWGEVAGTEKVFGPDDCWALRRGKVHRVKDSGSPLRCAHANKSHANGYICVQLVAQGETLGVLYVENLPETSGLGLQARPDQGQVLERQATAVGERISLALANLRLREVLRSKSIRDPLTGLYNRRFMEESMERELSRAIRGKQQVAVLMLDIDHFKHFNDTFGHQAGDALLRALGSLLKESTRGQDVACRYGGEEFAFVLAGASLDAARKLAERLREQIKKLNVRHGGQLLGAVTLSVGIAVFPDNGDSAAQLLKAADDALYRAKAEGRDRIISA
jgi:diguanylate cyclase (GGDEF)-like protein/PAS domain S-box-containing protein